VKKCFIILFLILNYVNFSFAEDFSKKISEYVSNLIPGEGTSEVSIELRENYKPDFSILGVRQLDKTDNENSFIQFSLFNSEKLNKERYIGNFGYGKRYLSNENMMIAGFNTFLDYDHYGNARASIGGELKNAVLEFSSNYYQKIDNGSSDEEVLDGYDIHLESQVPFLHWADIFYNSYNWDGVDRADIKGTKIGSELILTSHVNLELAYDDKDKKGLEDEWYAKIQFVHPPREDGPTALDGISDTAWNKNKDMSDEMLSKVKRNNKIVVEFKGLSTISRTD
tara:strand:- start:688 stop:1533 length:846 start_codon:yes stop_codon:yes gene_type:complete